MKLIKSMFTPMVVAAVLGLGVGFGVSQPAEASRQTCRAACAAEFRACNASGDDFYLCRGLYSACLRRC